MITRTQFIKNYQAAEKRAIPAAVGLSFSVEDRIILTAQRKALGLTPSAAAWAVAPNGQEASKAASRFNLWEDQIVRGEIRMAPAATGEHVGKGVYASSNPVRIKSHKDVQPIFTELTGDLIKLGITNEQAASAYLARGFEYHRTEQKLGQRVTRIVDELRLGDLTKDQAIAVLDRARASIVA